MKKQNLKTIPLSIAGIILIVLGALMIADSTLVFVGQFPIFFEGVNSRFEFVVGIITIISAANIIELKEK